MYYDETKSHDPEGEEPQPDESRLLTAEEMDKAYKIPDRHMNWPFHLRSSIAQAQDAKTARLVAEQIFDAMEQLGLYHGEAVEEGRPYLYLGCYILRWGKVCEPSMGFLHISDDPRYQALRQKWCGKEKT